MSFKSEHRQETLIYLTLWTILFIAPVMSLYIRTHSSDSEVTFQWAEVFIVWRQFGVFLLLFLLHNHLLAPLLVYKQKKIVYFSAVIVMMVAFLLYQCSTRPAEDELAHRRLQHLKGTHLHPSRTGQSDSTHRQAAFSADFDEFSDFDDKEHEPPEFRDGDPSMKPGAKPIHHGEMQQRPVMREMHEKRMMKREHPPIMVGEHDIIAAVILFLMLGMNDGVKLYFRTRYDRRKLAVLEKENLEQQLEYLKYQINPHFFMNTLNNIHALVDIDPEKAKDTIVELSKMMRFVLYEGNKHGVPLSREFDFIRNYITLMRLRYTDKVRIQVDLPAEAPDRMVPPLMLITFIENAFKHGISYQRASFIEVGVELEGQGNQLHFTCRNSKADKPNQEKGGVGLANVKQRLKLLYDNNFTLTIQDEADLYSVDLTIPLSNTASAA